jgi:hypothetical protein
VTSAYVKNHDILPLPGHATITMTRFHWKVTFVHIYQTLVGFRRLLAYFYYIL